MEKEGSKPVIGIVGGVCSGKSTVAAELAKLGCAVIDADEIAHQLLEDERLRGRIVGLFGEGVLGSQGKVSRSKLAEIVFADAGKLESLDAILHPPVLARVEELIGRYEGQPEVRAIVLDMPLLVEVGWDKRCNYVIFVDCGEQTRLERGLKTGLFGAAGLKIRENLQISLDKKRRIADTIVDNNSDLSYLSGQIADIFSSITDKG